MTTRTLWVQCWEESERGWGVRPDGWTIHPYKGTAWAYRDIFMREQRESLGDETPDEYTRPSGDVYEVPVTEEIYRFVHDNPIKQGLSAFGRTHAELYREGLIENTTTPWPADGGGWVSSNPPPQRLDVARPLLKYRIKALAPIFDWYEVEANSELQARSLFAQNKAKFVRRDNSQEDVLSVERLIDIKEA